MMFQKQNPLRDRAYLTWLRKQPCHLCGFGPCDPHHVKLLGNGGMGVKPPDDDAIPLNQDLHRWLDSPGGSEVALFRRFWGDDLSKERIKEKICVVAKVYYRQYKKSMGRRAS